MSASMSIFFLVLLLLFFQIIFEHKNGVKCNQCFRHSSQVVSVKRENNRNRTATKHKMQTNRYYIKEEKSLTNKKKTKKNCSTLLKKQSVTESL